MMFLLIYRKDMELVVSRVSNLITKIRYMMFLLKIYRKDMELVIFRVSDPITKIRYMMFLLTLLSTPEGHGVSDLSCFRPNHEDPIHDVPSDSSEYTRRTWS